MQGSSTIRPLPVSKGCSYCSNLLLLLLRSKQSPLGFTKASSPQRFCPSVPSRNGSEFSQATYRKKKSRGLQLWEGAERVQRFAGAGAGCGWMRMGGYWGGGAWRHGPAHWPLANDSGIAFLEGSGVHRDSRGVIKYSVREAGRRRRHRMMQHLQKRCLLPPTDGGGVTGAK